MKPRFSIAALVYPSNNGLSLALWALTLLVGLSRVYTGLHHRVDIIGSMLMAILVAALVYLVIERNISRGSTGSGSF